MAETISTAEAAERLGVTRHRVTAMIQSKELRARKQQGRGPTGYVYRINPVDLLPFLKATNGHAKPTAPEPEPQATKRASTWVDGDPLLVVADDLIALGKRLKAALKEHDDRIRKETIRELGSSLVEGASK